MPTAYLKKLATINHISVDKLEKFWSQAKEIAKSEGNGKAWGLITTIFQNKLKKEGYKVSAFYEPDVLDDKTQKYFDDLKKRNIVADTDELDDADLGINVNPKEYHKQKSLQMSLQSKLDMVKKDINKETDEYSKELETFAKKLNDKNRKLWKEDNEGDKWLHYTGHVDEKVLVNAFIDGAKIESFDKQFIKDSIKDFKSSDIFKTFKEILKGKTITLYRGISFSAKRLKEALPFLKYNLMDRNSWTTSFKKARNYAEVEKLTFVRGFIPIVLKLNCTMDMCNLPLSAFLEGVWGRCNNKEINLKKSLKVNDISICYYDYNDERLDKTVKEFNKSVASTYLCKGKVITASFKKSVIRQIVAGHAWNLEKFPECREYQQKFDSELLPKIIEFKKKADTLNHINYDVWLNGCDEDVTKFAEWGYVNGIPINELDIKCDWWIRDACDKELRRSITKGIENLIKQPEYDERWNFWREEGLGCSYDDWYDKLKKVNDYISQRIGNSKMKNTYLCNGEVVTASSKQEAVKVFAGKQTQGKKTSYKTVNIGGKTWMAENLAYDDGGKGIFYNSDNGEYYYTLEAAKRIAKKLGWRVPKRDEFLKAIKECGNKDKNESDIDYFDFTGNEFQNKLKIKYVGETNSETKNNVPRFIGKLCGLFTSSGNNYNSNVVLIKRNKIELIYCSSIYYKFSVRLVK